MLKRRVWFVFAALLLSLSFFTGQAHADSGSPMPLFPTSDVLQGEFSKYPFENYAWDTSGFLAGANPTYNEASLGFNFASFLDRTGIMLLAFSFHPEMIGNYLGEIAKFIGESQVSYLPKVMVWVGLGFVFTLSIDFAKRQPQKTIKRLTSFATVVVALFALYSFTEDGLTQATETIGEFANYAGSVVVSTGDLATGQDNQLGSDQFVQIQEHVTDTMWRILIENPWQLGEFGVIDQSIGAADLSDVQSAIKDDPNAPSITKDTRWADVVLLYPPGSSERNKLVDILNNDSHQTSKAAFSPEYRSGLALGMNIAAITIIPFCLVFGLVLLVLHLLYIFCLLAAPLIVPLAMIPIFTSPVKLNWLIRLLLFSIVGQVVVSMYIGFVFLITLISEKIGQVGGNSNPSSGYSSYMAMVYLNAFWYLLSVVLFVFLVLKFRAVPKLSQWADERFASPAQSRFEQAQKYVTDRMRADKDNSNKDSDDESSTAQTDRIRRRSNSQKNQENSKKENSSNPDGQTNSNQTSKQSPNEDDRQTPADTSKNQSPPPTSTDRNRPTGPESEQTKVDTAETTGDESPQTTSSETDRLRLSDQQKENESDQRQQSSIDEQNVQQQSTEKTVPDSQQQTAPNRTDQAEMESQVAATDDSDHIPTSHDKNSLDETTYVSEDSDEQPPETDQTIEESEPSTSDHSLPVNQTSEDKTKTDSEEATSNIRLRDVPPTDQEKVPEKQEKPTIKLRETVQNVEVVHEEESSDSTDTDHVPHGS